MYTQQKISLLKSSFWTRFGQYMKPVPGASGEKVNWINYRTGVNHIHFKMQSEEKLTQAGLVIDDPDTRLRHQRYSQLLSFKKIFDQHREGQWNWQKDRIEDGKIISCVNSELKGQSIYQEENWPAIISFLKPRLIMLDSFWITIKPFFE